LHGDEISQQPEVNRADCEEICPWWRFLQGPGTAMQDRVMHLIFKKFNTLVAASHKT
jgi:hypothetical protein